MVASFIINLPKSSERREACIKTCQEAELEPEVFEATNGREVMAHLDEHPEIKSKLAIADEVKISLPLGRSVVMGDKLSPAEVGCAFSHLRLYQEILDRNLDYALVLEDDALLKPDFAAVLAEVIKHSDKWDLVQFAHLNGIRSFFWSKPIKLTSEFSMFPEGMRGLNPIFNRRRMSFLLSCFLINRKACQRLIDLGYPVRMPADYLTGLIAYNGLRLYTCHPQDKLVICNAFASDIDGTGDARPLHRMR